MSHELFPVLERIAVALEQLSAAHGAPRAEEPVKASKVKASKAKTQPQAPVEETATSDEVEKFLDGEPFTREQLMTVCEPFRKDNQPVLVKEALAEVGVVGLSNLVDRKKQNQWLLLMTERAKLIESKDAAIAAINTLSRG